jgi:hypothetical protein
MTQDVCSTEIASSKYLERSDYARCANYIINQNAKYPLKYSGLGPTVDQDA